MPYHLELGSGDNKMHERAFVVNSRTGEHKSHNPIPIERAEAQKRVLEDVAAHEKKLNHESASSDAPAKMNQEVTPRRVIKLKKSSKEEEVKEAEAMKAEKAKTSKLSDVERKLMDSISGADTVKHSGDVVSSPSDMIKKIVMSHYDKSVFGRDAESKEHTQFRSKVNHILKYLKTTDNADHKVIHDMLFKTPMARKK